MTTITNDLVGVLDDLEYLVEQLTKAIDHCDKPMPPDDYADDDIERNG